MVFIITMIITWLKNARYQALPQSLLPALLAVCMASKQSDFSLILGTLAIFGVLFVHLSINLFDDYFDYKVKKSEYRDELVRQGVRARIAKCHYLTSGEATLKQLLMACFAFGCIALLFGIVIFIYRGMPILYLTVFTVLLGISYSGPPLKLSYRGLGELLIGLMFGPLSMAGVYYAACGSFGIPVVLVSIPVGLQVVTIVYSHSIMDYEPDKQVGKMTFAVLLGNKKLMLVALFFLLFIPFLMVGWGVIFHYLPASYLFVFLTLPTAVSLFYMMVEFVKHPQRTFTPKFWMGPMPEWKKIQAAGLDWFMIRWLSARNLLTFFCLILIIILLIQ